MAAIVTRYPEVSAGLAIIEVWVFTVAGFGLFRQIGYTLAESMVYGIIGMMMILSLIFQVNFLLSHPWISIYPELLLFGLSLVVLVRCRKYLLQVVSILKSFQWDWPLGIICCALVALYLAVQAVWLAPDPAHWADLTHLLLCQQEQTLFPPGPMKSLSFPMNMAILPHLTLRFHTDIGVGIFNFLSWVCIGFATYALARRYAWPVTAITATLIVVSMPRLVLHATGAGMEIIHAAGALFCLLALNRTIEEPNILDLLGLILGLLFLISGKSLVFLLPVIFLGLSVVLLIRRHGTGIWIRLIANHPWITLAGLLPGLIFSQIPVFIHNLQVGNVLIPTAPDMVKNPDEIIGAGANLCRYLLESAHFTRPLDVVCHWMFSFRPMALIQGIYAALVDPIFGQRGAVAPFTITWLPDPAISWFGPLAFLFILPALAMALVQGHRRIKATGLALVGYVYMVTLLVAWKPGNAGWFSVWFVCAGFMTAYLLPPWRITIRGRRWIHIMALMLMGYACVCNLSKPMVRMTLFRKGMGMVRSENFESAAACFWDSLAEGVWGKQVNYANRVHAGNRLYGDDRVRQILERFKDGAIIGLRNISPAHGYAWMLAGSNVRWMFLTDENQSRGDKWPMEVDCLIQPTRQLDKVASRFQLTRFWPEHVGYSGGPTWVFVSTDGHPTENGPVFNGDTGSQRHGTQRVLSPTDG